MTYFETTNRKLEQFLYIHGIEYMEWYKAADGMTVWVYERTADLERIKEEYVVIAQKRTAKNKAKYGRHFGRRAFGCA